MALRGRALGRYSGSKTQYRLSRLGRDGQRRADRRDRLPPRDDAGAQLRARRGVLENGDPAGGDLRARIPRRPARPRRGRPGPP